MKIKPPLRGGVVLGAKRIKNRFKIWLDTDDTHVLLIGATRSGKSRRIILPTILTLAHAGESMIITDPKGELHKMSAGYLKKLGYDVVMIDFRSPFMGNRWNPLLSVITDDITEASQAAWDLGHTITYQQPHFGEQVWPQSQESVTTALALAVALEAPEKARHIGSVYHLMSVLGINGGAELDLYFTSLPSQHPARLAYTVAAMAPYRMKGSIFASTAAQLKLWADPKIQWLTADQDHDLAAPGQKKTAVFLVIPDERSTRYVLASLYITQVYQSLVDLALANDNRLPIKVNFLLDEFGNLPAITDMDKKITVAGGRGMKFLLAVQNLAQIKDYYGKKAQTITGNCSTWIYLSTADLETMRVISALTGPKTVETQSQSAQVRDKDYSHSHSQSLTGRPLLMVDEVKRWPKGQALILPSRQYPASLPLPDLSEWPLAKHLVESKEKIRTEAIILPEVWSPEISENNSAVPDDSVPEMTVEDMIAATEAAFDI